MVAGVTFDSHNRIIERCLNVGDRVQIVLEPDNQHDEFAVAVTLTDGRKIGYVPRTESEDVTNCVDGGGYYVATVKKILTGGHAPVPVIVLQFYRPDQFTDIADINPDPCSTAKPASTSAGCLSALSYLLTSPFLWLLLALRSLALSLAKLALFAVTAMRPLALSFCKLAFTGVKAVVKWVASVKADLQGTPERKIDPVSFIGKLLAIAAVSVVLIILLIRLLLFAASQTR